MVARGRSLEEEEREEREVYILWEVVCALLRTTNHELRTSSCEPHEQWVHGVLLFFGSSVAAYCSQSE